MWQVELVWYIFFPLFSDSEGSETNIIIVTSNWVHWIINFQMFYIVFFSGKKSHLDLLALWEVQWIEKYSQILTVIRTGNMIMPRWSKPRLQIFFWKCPYPWARFYSPTSVFTFLLYFWKTWKQAWYMKKKNINNFICHVCEDTTALKKCLITV